MAQTLYIAPDPLAKGMKINLTRAQTHRRFSQKGDQEGQLLIPDARTDTHTRNKKLIFVIRYDRPALYVYYYLYSVSPFCYGQLVLVEGPQNVHSDLLSFDPVNQHI